jgi:hypothetical protein
VINSGCALFIAQTCHFRKVSKEHGNIINKGIIVGMRFWKVLEFRVGSNSILQNWLVEAISHPMWDP